MEADDARVRDEAAAWAEEAFGGRPNVSQNLGQSNSFGGLPSQPRPAAAPASAPSPAAWGQQHWQQPQQHAYSQAQRPGYQQQAQPGSSYPQPPNAAPAYGKYPPQHSGGTGATGQNPSFAPHAQQQRQAPQQQYPQPPPSPGFYGHKQAPAQQRQWQQQQPQAAYGAARAAQTASAAPAPAASSAQPHSSEKYAKMMQQPQGQNGNTTEPQITAVKRNILIHWALQPPQMQALRPVAVLLTTIHKVFPPAFGVKGHTYFSSWKPVPQHDLLNAQNKLDDEKLRKGVRKLRFFLHPDKLPRDLDEEQSFMCKMLWDVSNDAFEEFKAQADQLDWINS
mmetsp:Transcript_26858/g.39292  ORF Transcript_26858/g.39292 Transcript_26858/m.39292 type:complete len:337 (-) Transcript_26858:111-1121(-)